MPIREKNRQAISRKIFRQFFSRKYEGWVEISDVAVECIHILDCSYVCLEILNKDAAKYYWFVEVKSDKFIYGL